MTQQNVETTDLPLSAVWKQSQSEQRQAVEELPKLQDKKIKNKYKTMGLLSNKNALWILKTWTFLYLQFIWSGMTSDISSFNQIFIYLTLRLWVTFNANVLYSHDQKTGRVREMSAPSTSRTGTPLKTQKHQEFELFFNSQIKSTPAGPWKFSFYF